MATLLHHVQNIVTWRDYCRMKNIAALKNYCITDNNIETLILYDQTIAVR
jgi:hypothetical protein